MSKPWNLGEDGSTLDGYFLWCMLALKIGHILTQEATVNDSATNLTENVKRAALLQKLGYKSCLVTNHWYLVTTQPPTNSH